MSLFNRTKKVSVVSKSQKKRSKGGHHAAVGGFGELALRTIDDGVIVADATGAVDFMNPAAVKMTGVASDMSGLDYKLVLKLEDRDGNAYADERNPVFMAISKGENLERFPCALRGATAGMGRGGIGTPGEATTEAADNIRKIPIVISVLLADEGQRIISFRDVTREAAKEEEQSEFISTASHEMRTPVASIEGYLGLALNPQTATIDERARKYLDSAHAAAKHLGKLFQDLLDVTKLDDLQIAPQLRPVDLAELVQGFTEAHMVQAKEKGVTLEYSPGAQNGFGAQVAQKIYCSVDVDFVREIVDNLVDNAIKYTPSGGMISVVVKGDAKRAAIVVKDSGMGISAEDLKHVFQKFYRADNSDTRTIGGTGLGLYLVKQRAEALGGTVGAKSILGSGSTFSVLFPRISSAEYQKRLIAVQNQALTPDPKVATEAAAIADVSQPTAAPAPPPVVGPASQPVVAAPVSQPVLAPVASAPAPASVPSAAPVTTSAPVAAPVAAPASVPIAPISIPTSVPMATPVTQPAPATVSTPIILTPISVPATAPVFTSVSNPVTIPASTPAATPVLTPMPTPAPTLTPVSPAPTVTRTVPLTPISPPLEPPGTPARTTQNLPINTNLNGGQK